jgi:hypothetical protein
LLRKYINKPILRTRSPVGIVASDARLPLDVRGYQPLGESGQRKIGEVRKLEGGTSVAVEAVPSPVQPTGAVEVPNPPCIGCERSVRRQGVNRTRLDRSRWEACRRLPSEPQGSPSTDASGSTRCVRPSCSCSRGVSLAWTSRAMAWATSDCSANMSRKFDLDALVAQFSGAQIGFEHAEANCSSRWMTLFHGGEHPHLRQQGQVFW